MLLINPTFRIPFPFHFSNWRRRRYFQSKQQFKWDNFWQEYIRTHEGGLKSETQCEWGSDGYNQHLNHSRMPTCRGYSFRRKHTSKKNIYWKFYLTIYNHKKNKSYFWFMTKSELGTYCSNSFIKKFGSRENFEVSFWRS